MTVNAIADYLVSKNCRLRGCNERQISKIESHYGIRLPGVYRDFLWRMGKDAGEYLLGSSVFYDEIFDLKEGAAALLQENEMEFPDDAFVFWMHQGYQFAFFYLQEGDDPPVYFYYEGRKEFEETGLSFSGFLARQIKVSGL